MCEIFIRASEQSYAPETRSLRLHGVATSLRLEQLFWQVLEEIAGRDGMRVTQLIERLYDELIEYRGQAANFTSFLRVCCLRYQLLQAEGRIPLDAAVPIRSLNAKAVLEGLPATLYDAQRCLPATRGRLIPTQRKGPDHLIGPFRCLAIAPASAAGLGLRQRDFALHDAADAYRVANARELAL